MPNGLKNKYIWENFMKKTQKRIEIGVGLGCILIILVCVMVFAIPKHTQAYAFTGQAPSVTGNYTREDFLSETNTYNATSVNQSTLTTTYNMSTKNSLSVFAVPQITVLTHGLSGDAGHWSNAYSNTNSETDFAYDPDSLISNLSEQAGGANVYWSVLQENKENFDLYDITNEIGEYDPSQLTLINKITGNIL
jgi:hypothetical protein